MGYPRCSRASEASVLNGLQHHLMAPALFEEFCAEFTREVNRLRMKGGASLDAQRTELPKIKRQIQAIIEAVKDSLYQSSMKAEMERLEARKAEIEQALVTAEAPPPLLHPSLAEVYRIKISSLAENLARDDTRAEQEKARRSWSGGRAVCCGGIAVIIGCGSWI